MVWPKPGGEGLNNRGPAELLEKPHRSRARQNLLDKAQQLLVELMAEKDAQCASGRFGVMIVRDQSGHTGIRKVIDEGVFVS